MSKSYLLLFLVIVIVIIIVGLFIELSYNKSHASYVFLAPQTMTVIKAKNLDISDDIILYNSAYNITHRYRIYISPFCQ